MVSKGRETIPPLPAEGRTSMDLPRDAEREFYAAIGYLPLGDHAIRADMVERLAAMARQAVRESREAARRAQQAKPQEKKPEAARVAEAPSTPAADGEISEWAIVAAAFGEAEPTPEPAPTPEPVEEAPKIEEAAPVAAEAVASDGAVEESKAEEAKSEDAKPEHATAEEAKPEEPKKEMLKPLPPGHFRAAPQMMSLVGCSEPEMANVLRGLGYRVHPPSEENGPLHSFSVKPRFVREREEQRERQRQQEKERRDQRRRERPERPNERQFFADSPPRSETRHNGPKDGPRRDGPRPDRAKDGPPREDRRGPRPQRRDPGGPALRLYATTEKKGDAAADSPFAKLLELKLGGKK
jgi:hypothetical protein